jgi:hypothetical protein
VRTPKVEKYRKNLIKLRQIRASKAIDKQEEKNVLEVMETLWTSMSMEERDYFNKTNHLSWPPPRETGEKK